MQKLVAALFLAGGAAIATGGCYHATIETGATPSATVVEQQWAAGWIFGLVPPKTVNTSSQCQKGVAKVETQMSFLNGLVAAITFDIFTPMTIKVTCAENRMGALSTGVVEHLAATATDEAFQAAFARAAEDAVVAGAPVYVVIDQK